jgi:hypothetical protein
MKIDSEVWKLLVCHRKLPILAKGIVDPFHCSNLVFSVVRSWSAREVESREECKNNDGHSMQLRFPDPFWKVQLVLMTFLEWLIKDHIVTLKGVGAVFSPGGTACGPWNIIQCRSITIPQEFTGLSFVRLPLLFHNTHRRYLLAPRCRYLYTITRSLHLTIPSFEALAHLPYDCTILCLAPLDTSCNQPGSAYKSDVIDGTLS